jgi:serine/threonine-protein kinase RsbW
VDVSANRRKLRISARRARVVLILARVEESAEELYEDAPCGYMSSLMDGTIVRVNRTFLRWTGLARDEVVGRKVATLFSPASRLYFEVHASPLLRLEGEVHGLALELGGAHGRTLPVLIDAKLKRDERGEPRFVRTTFFDATERTAHERQLLEARRGEQAARERMALLAEVGRGLDEVRTLPERAQRLVELLVPAAARGAWVDLGDERTEEPEVTAVDDSTVIETLLAARRRVPATAEPRFEGDVAILPLRARDRALGVLGLVDVPEALAADRDFLADLAARAATALENARLYDHERSVAHALQHSLLAADLPEDPRLVLAPRYRSGVASLEVGGDWYDAFELEPGRIGICVGDVVARGLEAATTMGQLRSALRALAAAQLGPAGVLERLDAFAEQVPRGRMATIVYAELDLDSGRLRYACAGHPPPLLADPEGRAQLLEGARSAPLGAATGPRPEADIVLAPGARLIFYTDGLIDRRGRPLERGLALLVDEAGKRRAASAARLADALLEALQPEQAEDDVCLLGVAFGAGPRFDRELGAQAEELAPLRDDLRAWLTGNAVVGHDRDALVFAASEAVTNAIEHAYRDVAAGLVWVSATMGSDGVVLRVTDHGRWRPPGELEDRGRGLLLLDKLMDDVAVDHEKGTTITMRKQVSGE